MCLCMNWVLEELRFGRRSEFRPPNALWRWLRLPKAASGSWTFGSVMHIRPPKVPPNMHEFRLWREVRPPKVPPKLSCPAFLCMLNVIVLRAFRGVLGSCLRVSKSMFDTSIESFCVGLDPTVQGGCQD